MGTHRPHLQLMNTHTQQPGPPSCWKHAWSIVHCGLAVFCCASALQKPPKPSAPKARSQACPPRQLLCWDALRLFRRNQKVGTLLKMKVARHRLSLDDVAPDECSSCAVARRKPHMGTPSGVTIEWSRTFAHVGSPCRTVMSTSD